MKKLIFTLVVAFICIGASSTKAQRINTTQWSIKAGMNLTKYNGFPSVIKSSSEPGFYLGGGMQYMFTENIFFDLGLNLSIKRSTAKSDLGILDNLLGDLYIVNEKATINPIYLHIPIHAGYKFYLNETTRLNLSAGPFLAYGLGGKTKIEGEKFDVFGSDDGFKRFDFGLGIKAALDINKINIQMGYDFGLVNVNNILNDIHTRNFYMGLGYNF